MTGGLLPVFPRRVGAQLVDAVVPYQQFGQRITVVDHERAVGPQGFDRLVRAPLPLTDRRQQGDRVERFRIAPRHDPGLQQRRDLLVPAQPGTRLDQGLGEEPVRDVREEQRVGFLAPPAPGERQRQVTEREPLSSPGERTDETKGLFAPPSRPAGRERGAGV
ncbi:hypothetical protein ACPCTN_31335 [Streptomyces cinereoruber]|uniref:hypothetical protein n=1 Tax=Streptomyces cinereoruber TaxID=67260 RepID=UPI003C2F0D58